MRNYTITGVIAPPVEAQPSSWRVRIITVLLSVMLLTPGACAVPEAQSASTVVTGEAPQRPLARDALRALLSGVYVTRVRPSEMLVSHPPGEIFLADGVYQRVVGRTSVEGRFEIEGAAVCVEGADFPRRCRQVIPRGKQTYSFVDQADGSAELVTITPLR